MKINILTDAIKHNIAAMKISSYHKLRGDKVCLNNFGDFDFTYVSILFDWNVEKFSGNKIGGPAIINSKLPTEIEKCKPDYNLFNIDFSLGYTFRPCFRKCNFCKVSRFDHPDTFHHSIYEFYDKRFNKICLLNNNTFSDKNWKDTFDEIEYENLIIIDENGYDIRLIDEEKAYYLRKLKIKPRIHFAWDRMQDEKLVLDGIKILKKFKIHATFYVLICYDTSQEDDIYRCQILKDSGFDIYIMPFHRNWYGRSFKRFIDSFMWRKYKLIEDAWNDYKPNKRRKQINKFKQYYLNKEE